MTLRRWSHHASKTTVLFLKAAQDGALRVHTDPNDDVKTVQYGDHEFRISLFDRLKDLLELHQESDTLAIYGLNAIGQRVLEDLLSKGNN